MNKLIEALAIFIKYGNPDYPTHCEHDVLRVMINPSDVDGDDQEKLEELGFIADEDEGDFMSFRYGSA